MFPFRLPAHATPQEHDRATPCSRRRGGTFGRWLLVLLIALGPLAPALAAQRILIVTSTEMAPAAELLERIAPTYVISVYKKDARPFDRAREMLISLGEITGRFRADDGVLGAAVGRIVGMPWPHGGRVVCRGMSPHAGECPLR